jgi:hypothetical protein
METEMLKAARQQVDGGLKLPAVKFRPGAGGDVAENSIVCARDVQHMVLQWP